MLASSFIIYQNIQMLMFCFYYVRDLNLYLYICVFVEVKKMVCKVFVLFINLIPFQSMSCSRHRLLFSAKRKQKRWRSTSARSTRMVRPRMTCSVKERRWQTRSHSRDCCPVSSEYLGLTLSMPRLQYAPSYYAKWKPWHCEGLNMIWSLSIDISKCVV